MPESEEIATSQKHTPTKNTTKHAERNAMQSKQRVLLEALKQWGVGVEEQVGL